MAKGQVRDPDPSGNNASQESDDRSKKAVRYIGGADVRRISADDLREAGLTGENLPNLEWNRGNKWTVSMSDIPQEVFDVAIRPDRLQFVVIDKG